jgi:hypothetical protein
MLNCFEDLKLFTTFKRNQKLENMKLFQIFLFATILIFLSCERNNSLEIPGEYSFRNTTFPTKIKWMLKGKRKFFAGTRLNLNEDRSFSFSTCGCKTKGDWNMTLDTIYLKHRDIDASIDTSRCYFPKVYLHKNNMIIGANKNEYVEVLTKKE